MRSEQYRQKKRKNRLRLFLTLFVCILLFVILLLALLLIALHNDSETPDAPPAVASQTEPATAQAPPEAEPDTPAGTAQSPKQTSPEPQRSLQETDIYTFLQGPKAWEGKVDWSGSWCHEVLADQEFSVFGCGLCVLASIYGTLTPCDCSPLDMFYYAREVSGYAPSSGYGAIDWPYMQQTLRTVGISSKLRRKNVSYRHFQEAVAANICTVALVSSYNDDTYWHDVEGHYVTLWLYDSRTDTVFLSDSGNPDHNRQRIPLRYIYDALKTAGTHQYMLITGADPSANTWQHDGIDIKWRRPKYYRKRTS